MAFHGTTYDAAVDAVSGSKYTWNNGVRAKDMHDVLIHLTPSDFVTWDIFKQSSTNSTSPEWLQETLAAIDEDNYHTEGADFTYGAPNIPATMQNNTRIFRKTAQLSGSAMHDKTYQAVASLKEHQTSVRMREIKRDMNFALLNSVLTNSGEGTARRFRGLEETVSNASNETAATGNAISEDNVKLTMAGGIWQAGFNPTDLIVHSDSQELIDAMFTSTTKFIDVDEHRAVEYVNIIDTGYGRINVHLERDGYLPGQAAGDGANIVKNYMIDRDMFEVCWFRPTFGVEPAYDGDRWRFVIMNEWTFKDCAGGEAAQAITTLT